MLRPVNSAHVLRTCSRTRVFVQCIADTPVPHILSDLVSAEHLPVARCWFAAIRGFVDRESWNSTNPYAALKVGVKRADRIKTVSTAVSASSNLGLLVSGRERVSHPYAASTPRRSATSRGSAVAFVQRSLSLRVKSSHSLALPPALADSPSRGSERSRSTRESGYFCIHAIFATCVCYAARSRDPSLANPPVQDFRVEPTR